MTNQLPKAFRTKREGFYILKSNSWGTFYKKADDPEGLDVVPEEYFQLNSNFGKIPIHIWERVISLYRKYVKITKHGGTEVQVIFLNAENNFNEWKVIVPQQKVTAASVRSQLTNSIDLLTGEEYDSYPPRGYVVSGDSHSHGTMNAFFSSVDNTSELNGSAVLS